MQAVIRSALALALLSTSACHNLKPVTIDQAHASPRVWLTLSDRSVVVVDGPQIYGDKVVGFVMGRYAEFPTADVQKAQMPEPARTRTAALVAASVLAVGGIVAWTVSAQGSGAKPEPDPCDTGEPDIFEVCG